MFFYLLIVCSSNVHYPISQRSCREKNTANSFKTCGQFDSVSLTSFFFFTGNITHPSEISQTQLC